MSDAYTGTIAKTPKVSEKTINFTLKLEDDKTVHVVGFFHRLDAKYVDTLRTLAVDQSFEFMGTKNYNSKFNREEVAIDGPFVKQMTVEEALAMPDPDLVPLKERFLPERKYTFTHPKSKQVCSFWSDGIYIWMEGEKHDKQELNYDAVHKYNSVVTLDKWLMPDWYTVETAKRRQAELDANPKVAAILEELSVY